MNNKYIILVLTFLYMLIGHQSYGQDYNEDAYGNPIVNDTVFLPELPITNNYTDVDNTPDIYLQYSHFLNNTGNYCLLCDDDIVVPEESPNPIPTVPVITPDCWYCDENNNYAGVGVSLIAPLSNGSAYREFRVPGHYRYIIDYFGSHGYQIGYADLGLYYSASPHSDGIGFLKIPIIDVRALGYILSSTDQQYHREFYQFYKLNPVVGLKILKAYTASLNKEDAFINNIALALIASSSNVSEAMAQTLIAQIIQYYDYELNRLRIENPNWSEFKLKSTAALNLFNTGIDIVGMAPSPEANIEPIGLNLLNKTVITKGELSKSIQYLLNRYAISTKDNYQLTTSDGKTIKGKVMRFYDQITGNSFYYFTPDTNSDLLKSGNYYKIPAPISNDPPNTNNNINLNLNGMPIGFQSISIGTGNLSMYMQTNDDLPTPYCQGCSQIEMTNDPQYPEFQKVIPKIKTLVLNNTTILNSLIQVSGYNLAQIKNLLSDDSLKKILRVSNISTWGLFENTYTPNILFIRKNLIASLETGGFKLGGSNESVYSTSFFIAMVILHELVHYGRYWNNLPQRVTIGNSTYEAGEVFETNIFGSVLGIDGITNKATQYGWTF